MKSNKVFNVQYVKDLPGMIVTTQSICCFLAFILGVAGPFNSASSVGFFNFTTFMYFIAALVWLVLNICMIDRLFGRDIDWNIAGLIFHGTATFFLMVASCVLVDKDYLQKVYRAAGVFGFLGFSFSLVGLTYEFTKWHHNKSKSQPASASTGANKTHSLSDDDYDDDDEWSSEVPGGYTEDVTPGTYNQRGSYLEPPQGDTHLLQNHSGALTEVAITSSTSGNWEHPGT